MEQLVVTITMNLNAVSDATVAIQAKNKMLMPPFSSLSPEFLSGTLE